VPDNLAFSPDAETRGPADMQAEPAWLMPAEWSEPLAERLIQSFSRWAGVAAFVGATGALAWLIFG